MREKNYSESVVCTLGDVTPHLLAVYLLPRCETLCSLVPLTLGCQSHHKTAPMSQTILPWSRPPSNTMGMPEQGIRRKFTTI